MGAAAMTDLEAIRSSKHFDADWYLATYPDVAMMGMDPAEHFLRFGGMLRRDPGPRWSTTFYLETTTRAPRNGMNPLLHYLTREDGDDGRGPRHANVLWGAGLVAERGEFERAKALAKAHLPPEFAHTAAIPKANAAIVEGREEAWLWHFNGYLAHQDCAPLRFRGQGTFFDRLSTGRLAAVEDGPLVSVLMPAWNAETTVDAAAGSILRQTWRNLELLVVDDASTDGTGEALHRIAAADPRVRLLRNAVNVGPYVSKNRALMHARGAWITGHDADDWAHPQRLELQVTTAMASGATHGASMARMIRIRPDGYFSFLGRIGHASPDGVMRKATISCLFARDLLVDRLGFWDSVRFGADSEMIMRAEKVSGHKVPVLDRMVMLCLDLEHGLTNDPVHGSRKGRGTSPSRASYRESWEGYLSGSKRHGESLYLAFPQGGRRYVAPPEMAVSAEHLSLLLRDGEAPVGGARP